MNAKWQAFKNYVIIELNVKSYALLTGYRKARHFLRRVFIPSARDRAVYLIRVMQDHEWFETSDMSLEQENQYVREIVFSLVPRLRKYPRYRYLMLNLIHYYSESLVQSTVISEEQKKEILHMAGYRYPHFCVICGVKRRPDILPENIASQNTKQ